MRTKQIDGVTAQIRDAQDPDFRECRVSLEAYQEARAKTVE